MADQAAAAVALKDQGNKAFAAHDWPTAIEFYTKAIEADPTQPTYYSNRAQVRTSQRRIMTIADSQSRPT